MGWVEEHLNDTAWLGRKIAEEWRGLQTARIADFKYLKDSYVKQWVELFRIISEGRKKNQKV